MRTRIALVVGALIALTFGALGQSVVQQTLSGNETWQAGQGPGGPGAYITSDLVRNSTAAFTVSVSGNAVIGVASGWTEARWGGNVLVTGQPAAATLTLPPNPFPDGGIVGVCNVTAAAWATNVVTVAGSAGQTSPATPNDTLTTLAAGTCARFQFNLANTTWYRIQ